MKGTVTINGRQGSLLDLSLLGPTVLVKVMIAGPWTVPGTAEVQVFSPEGNLVLHGDYEDFFDAEAVTVADRTFLTMLVPIRLRVHVPARPEGDPA